MNKLLKINYLILVLIFSVLSFEQIKASSDPIGFNDLPRSIRCLILKDVAVDCLELNKPYGQIAAVNKQWALDLRLAAKHGFYPWMPCWKAYLAVTSENEDIYKMFFSGCFEFRHNPTDCLPSRTISFKPLETVLPTQSLNVSTCGDLDKYIRITTCSKQFFKVGQENQNRIAVLMCPYNTLKSRCADKFQAIVNSTDQPKPIAVVFRGGNWENLDWYDFVIVSFDDLNQSSLYDIWTQSVASDGTRRNRRGCQDPGRRPLADGWWRGSGQNLTFQFKQAQ